MVAAANGASDGGWGKLDSLVFAGSYEEVIRAAAGHVEDADAPAVVAALALGGRLDEAESVFAARLGGGGPLAARARFFLIAGFCHAGNSVKALALVQKSAASLRRGPALERFFACQGLALFRHFEGRLGRAQRVARRALAAALEADFPYGRFLSLDLLAHVSVHLGQVHAGMRLLAQASELADVLGYAANAATERAAALLFELRFSGGGEAALDAVEALVSAPGVSYFTRRKGLLDLSSARALRGEASLARAALEEARRIALTGADRRARARYYIGHALCEALSLGPLAAKESLAEARDAARGELALLAEVAFVELVFCSGGAAAVRDAEDIARTTGIERVRVAWQLAAGLAGTSVSIEDGLCRLLVHAAPLPPFERLREVVQARQLGLAPWALGVSPGQRLVLLGQNLLSEDRGQVTARKLESRPALRLLAELGRGYRSRAELMLAVWNISHFVPQRHTPTLHTAVSRLRVAIADPDWIVTYDEGYALAPGVELLLPNDGVLSLGQAGGEPASLPPLDERGRVLELVLAGGAMSSAGVARALHLSGSTALRLLRALCTEGRLAREGSGRATRYQRPKTPAS